MISRLIEDKFKEWQKECDNRFNTIKSNEEELNRIFIDIYGLADELTPDVEDKDVTIRKADLQREIKSLISYSVGCIFGRYSPYKDGLIFAGGDWNAVRNDYTDYGIDAKKQDGDSVGDYYSKYPYFTPDQNNILPITDNDYFDDDIVIRFIEFVKVVYGEETLAENLEFIANALYPNSTNTARADIRRYFVHDFYKHHIKTYSKKPIYWQFESGKQNGFKALIYLHRYDKYTVARVRTDYLHPLQRKYEAEIKRLEMLSNLVGTTDKEKIAYKKEITDLQKKIDECRAYDQAIAHIAHQAINLDLDDGVTANYAKFQNIEVPQGNGKIPLKMDLLSKI